MSDPKVEASENHLEEVDSAVDGIKGSNLEHVNTLGSVRLRHAVTNELVLVPQPSDDPNDPLNWQVIGLASKSNQSTNSESRSKRFRVYNAVVVCLAMVMCNFLAAGPTVAIVQISMDLFPPQRFPNFPASIAKVAFLFTTTSLMQGLGNLIWMPLIVKYGRRPVYICSFILYTATGIWAGLATTYANELAARILLGFASGSGECLAPLTIADIFFLHERGTIMSLYTASLNIGVSGGIIIAGLITIHNDWRYIYYVATALIGALTVLVIFTMPETSYIRQRSGAAGTYTSATVEPESQRPGKRSYLTSLKLYQGNLTSESLWRIFLRPIVMLALPPVLWATLVMSVTIGFLVAITSNFASAFAEAYGFVPWQSGLCFIAGLIGSAMGILFGGVLSDWVANYFTKLNGGIREPEHRLPTLIIGMLTTPLALVLYGVAIQHRLHWMVATFALGLLTFSIAQATNVSLLYVIDSYRPVAGEVVVAQLGFKALFGFLLFFYTNPWIAKSGYQNAFGAMAGISAAVLSMWIIFFVYGKRIRLASLQWPIIARSIAWHADRDIGE
ncbi:hypothetical protein LTR08_009162 [Meristemomyces frigidus]|nr:hypothetical protein LTR08_009162 [Meristemomyces frigidus]